MGKDERLVKDALSFATLVIAWLMEDEEKATRPWGRVRAGDIAIAPKQQLVSSLIAMHSAAFGGPQKLQRGIWVLGFLFLGSDLFE